MIWTIACCTTVDRRALFVMLKIEFEKQIRENNLIGKVEFIWEEDNKEMSVGSKSQLLLERSKALYWNRFDSDDFPMPDYVISIYNALQSSPDCVGFKILMTTNGIKEETCIHSLQNSTWERKNGTWLRTPGHFNPIKRSLAIKVGFQNERWGEDRIYSDLVTLLCRDEVYLDKYMFHYRYSDAVPHLEKYGFTR